MCVREREQRATDVVNICIVVVVVVVTVAVVAAVVADSQHENPADPAHGV